MIVICSALTTNIAVKSFRDKRVSKARGSLSPPWAERSVIAFLSPSGVLLVI